MKKHILLYFGSFNPIHIGHMIIASGALDLSGADGLWWVVSPHNPFKSKEGLMDENVRLNLVRQSVASDPRFTVCDIEFSLPRPGYTIHTLDALTEAFPDIRFSLLIGSDNVPGFSQWREAASLMRDYTIYVYPRETHPDKSPEPFVWLDLNRWDISSTLIRELISQGRSIRYLVPEPVWKHLQPHE
jgi:nicotinate-nucleotide adenylyltransferase